MLREGVYVFEPVGPEQIVLRLESGNDLVSRLVLSAPQDDTYAIPRFLLVEVMADETAGRWTFVGRFEMGPDGTLDTGLMAARRAQLIRITVVDSWASGPVGIASVTVY
jgi:hypothetical protein